MWFSRQNLTGALVILVATSAFPCLRHAGENAADWARANAWREAYHLPASPAPPASCDNESGCFCRGATLVNEDPVTAVADDGQTICGLVHGRYTWAVVPWAADPLVRSMVRGAADEASGRPLRVLYDSWLI